jgi:CheY-like chemotaxis protein
LEALVVDDDPLTRMLMSRLLSRLGCNVSTAENGEIALEMILGPGGRNTPSGDISANATPISKQSSSMSSDDSKYHVVFLDNQMPVLSGIRTVEKLRELGRADFVIGVTGNALLDDQNEYLEAGVDHVLTKPVLERSLRSMVLLADERRKRASPSVERPCMTT